MESLFILIPLSLLLVGLLAWILHWSVKSGQFDDLNGPGESILMDDDLPSPRKVSEDSQK
ncbi:cytochrome oxidase maturation protein, cbb3-type [Polynucleobacter wuianus]|uniref:Cytochrome oxidase maturation protein, cbb3-type n=1 Tax=Polynucleobacter wuianus TaxID=1743168 RepID=A0A191UGA7_9BURK|nr:MULTISPECIES: cbb3-type cytochrome oxidase assembly protein CcoS [Polynucleobacter]ANJ00045.1 cytochrome oxidase maturation protein, cbb3-type [Polynucleobacter wuianus]MBU3552880.1 cbb3-type cytochrome oxidase assembly protein CcoS [Polynucleobacter sp. MWH-Post4-6-1]MBU3610360.1 cbb3-type cytochrome oxidase assembly protein CcoS [Polynucleobacter wuianus]